ncbi:helix-turn-helix transcriptional regulator [Marinobacterium arenosum]|uniref:helix-turn-helix transcriptional regulator n=1 Tax=Marinobacterium arenosum TaxID=2862496 RepID=UPI001C9762CC|nr:LuxR C-terminal-related transcriptional regulator [Marinobacterium arenosum]MBY4675749.1 LuxR C-terminal-related transcriptional regulator [Marinobacterium arenosum]
MERTINQLILNIYKTVDQCSSSQLKEALFETLQDYITFDAGKWSVGRLNSEGGFDVYSHCMFNLPTDQKGFSPIYFQGAIAEELAEQPGTTVNIDRHILKDIDKDNVLSEIGSRLNIRAGLITMIRRVGFTDVSVISILRHANEPDFSEMERSCIEMICPHLVQAYHLGAQIKQGQELDSDQHWAIVDTQYYIRYCSDNFRSFVAQQVDHPVDDKLPDEMVAALEQREPHLGNLSIERRSLAGNAEFLSLRDRGVLAQLTPSEKRVVEHYARGLSYKKVAQQLEISHHTVIKHVNNVYRKLNINNKNQLIELVAPVLS